MKETTIVFEGGIDSLRTLADRSVRVQLATPELPSDTVKRMYDLLKVPGYVLISANPMSQEMIEEVSKMHDNSEISQSISAPKTPSQRLRAVLYKVWSTHHSDRISFREYYSDTMTEITNHYGNKLI
tara:strand:- start:412 stop:792 length:381 start_codon:yes stop_codon:yes gene_type:complete